MPYKSEQMPLMSSHCVSYVNVYAPTSSSNWLAYTATKVRKHTNYVDHNAHLYQFIFSHTWPIQWRNGNNDEFNERFKQKYLSLVIILLSRDTTACFDIILTNTFLFLEQAFCTFPQTASICLY